MPTAPAIKDALSRVTDLPLKWPGLNLRHRPAPEEPGLVFHLVFQEPGIGRAALAVRRGNYLGDRFHFFST